jgi:hypothetical protein
MSTQKKLKILVEWLFWVGMFSACSLPILFGEIVAYICFGIAVLGILGMFLHISYYGGQSIY